MKIKSMICVILALVFVGCAAVSPPITGTATATTATDPQAKAARVSANLSAILADLKALAPAAGQMITATESVLAPELMPVTEAIITAINVADHASTVSLPK